MSRNWKGGSTRQWRRIRLAVLDRDGWQCRIRHPGICLSDATQVHHTQPRHLVGDDPDHLLSACLPCNMKEGEPGRPRRANRADTSPHVHLYDIRPRMAPDPPPKTSTQW